LGMACAALLGRTKMRTRHLLLALFTLAATGCVSEDLPPQPGYVSTGHDGVASVAPSVTGTGRGTIATNSSDTKITNTSSNSVPDTH
jgi:hypothetical protein